MAEGKRDVDPRALGARMRGRNPPSVLDVRSGAEFAVGHVPGARHVPFWSASWRAKQLGLMSDDPIVVYCGHGPRAALARTLLRLSGFTDVALLAGHMAGWRRAGLPEER